MTIIEEPPRYKTFLLTVWEERNPDRKKIIWRFGLEDPRTGQRRAFSGLQALVTALQWMVHAAEATDDTNFTLPKSGLLDADHDSESRKES